MFGIVKNPLVYLYPRESGPVLVKLQIDNRFEFFKVRYVPAEFVVFSESFLNSFLDRIVLRFWQTSSQLDERTYLA